MADRTANAGALVLAALGPAVLLAVDPWGWYPFGPLKWLLVTTLGLVGPALVLQARRPRVARPVALALVALLAWLTLAAALGEDPLYAWIGTPERHLGVLTWLLCALLLVTGTALDERSARTVVDGLVVAGLGVGAVATAEALGWEPRVLDVANRLSGTLGSPAYLGAATALLLPVAVGVALGATARARRVGAWGAVGLLAVACLGSGARAAWVGLAGAAAVVVAAVWPRVAATLRAQPRRAAAAALGGLVALALVVVLSPVGGRLADATDPDAAGGRGRLDEWRVATRVLADHPVVGVGPEGYRIAFHEGVDARYEQVHGRRQQPDRSHDGPLDVALAGGIPALVAWSALLVLVARAAWRTLRAGELWERGVAAALVAHWVGQLLLFPVVELEPIAWLLAGVLLARGGLAPRGREPDRRPTILVTLGGLALMALAIGATDVDADHRAEQAADALARGDGRAALSHADSAADLRPDIVRLHLLAAQAAVADQQGAAGGLRRVREALDVSPQDPIALLQEVALLVERAEATQTPAHLAEAGRVLDARLAEDPHAAALWRLEARLATVGGDPDRAAAATARADRLTPPDERELGG